MPAPPEVSAHVRGPSEHSQMPIHRLKSALLELERSRDRLVAAVRLAGGERQTAEQGAAAAATAQKAPEPDLISLWLSRARHAARVYELAASAAEFDTRDALTTTAAATAAVAVAAASTPSDVFTHPELKLLGAAEEVVASLTAVADALAPVAHGGPLLTTRAAAAAGGGIALTLVAQIAQSLARFLQRHVFRAADAAREALAGAAAERCVAASAAAALRAQDLAVVMMQAAVIGGLPVVQEALAAQRAAAEAAAAVGAAAPTVPHTAAAASAIAHRDAGAASPAGRDIREDICPAAPACVGPEPVQHVSSMRAVAAVTGTSAPFSPDRLSSNSGSCSVATVADFADAASVARAAASQGLGEPSDPWVTSAAPAALAGMSLAYRTAAPGAASTASATAAAGARAGPLPAAEAGAVSAYTMGVGITAVNHGASRGMHGAAEPDRIAVTAVATAASTASAATVGAEQLPGNGSPAAASRLEGPPPAIGRCAPGPTGPTAGTVITIVEGGNPEPAVSAQPRNPGRQMGSSSGGRSSSSSGYADNSDHVVTNMLSYLAGLADLATDDGRLPADALSQAAERCSRLLASPKWLVAGSLPAWADPGTRCGLMKLLSYSVRQMPLTAGCGSASASSGAAPTCPSHGWDEVFAVVCCSLHALFLQGPGSTMTEELLPEVIRLLVRADFLQCLSRLFAATTPTVEELAAVEVETEVVETEVEVETEVVEMDAGAAGTSGASAWDRIEISTQDAIRMLFSIILQLVRMEPANHVVDAPLRHELEGASRLVHGVMLRIRMLEHAVRWAVLPRRRGAVHSPGRGGTTDAPLAAAQSGADAAAAVRGYNTQIGAPPTCSTNMLVQHAPPTTFINMLNQVLNFSALQGDSRRPLAVWADTSLSGPCMQYFLLLHAVSQLCAADGGSDYGLPPGARLPARRVEDEMVAGVKGDSNNAGRAEPVPVTLSAAVMIRAFYWWARNRTRPCSDRALRALCERAAATATASWQATAGAAGGGGGGGGPALIGHFTPPEAAVELAVAAMDCAVALARGGGSASGFRGLWVPVVRIVNAAVQIRLHSPVCGAVSPLELLAALPLPALLAVANGDAGGPSLMPPEPGLDLTAALDAGYVPALERAVRHQTRLAGATVIESIVVVVENWRGLAGLMAYGEPRAVASLLATVTKVVALCRVAAFLGGGSNSTTRDLVKRLVGNVEAVLALAKGWNGSGSGPGDQHWWQRHSNGLARGGVAAAAAAVVVQPPPGRRLACGRGAAVAAGPSTAASGGASAGGAGAGSNGGGGGDVDGALLGALPPLHRLSLLAAFVTRCWLLFVKQAIQPGCNPIQLRSKTMTPASTSIFCLSPMLQAYLHSKQPEVTGPSEAAVDPAGGGDVTKADGGALRAAAAASWERLLLGSLDVPLLVRTAAQELSNNVLGFLPAKGRLVMTEDLVASLLHLLIAFPGQSRALLLQTGIKVGPSRKVTLLGWLRSVLAAAGEAGGGGGVSATVRHFLELAPVVAAGGQPSADDLARLRSEAECGWAARLGALLPPPCFAEPAEAGAAMWGLSPLCANPYCLSLEGDSEAALRLAVPCTGCGGAVSYCCRDCKLAHWRAGHKAECDGGGAGPAARGRGRGGG